MQLVLLQTIEQVYFSNFQKMKSHYQRFKQNAQDCLTEFQNFPQIEKVAKALGSQLGTKQDSQIAGPSENLKL